jgi:hypothetical protein
MEITFLEGIRQGIAEEMERDPDVFLIGEDSEYTAARLRLTAGMIERFGERRVVDTPVVRVGHRGGRHWARRSWGYGRWPKCSSPISSPAASTRS